MKWHYGPKPCESYGWYADSGNWRITISNDPNGFALLDKRDWSVVLVGTKDQCKAEAERRERQRSDIAA